MSEKKERKPFMVWLLSFMILLALLATEAAAWFVMNNQVTVGTPEDAQLGVQVNAGNLEISVSYRLTEQGHYGEYTPFSPYVSDYIVPAETPQLIDVTGDGTSLWFPQTLQAETDEPIYTLGDDWSNVLDQMGYCVTVKVKFRTASAMNVYLDKDSYVRECENITGGEYTRSSAYGNFSCDGIAGAARVAFLEVSETGSTDAEGNPVRNEELKALWIPNDKYELKNHTTENASFTTDGIREQNYGYYTKNISVMEQHLFTVDRYAKGEVLVGQEGLADGNVNMVNLGAPIVTFTEDGVTQEKEIVIRVWFEGTDRESKTDLDGGMLKYNFAFTGIHKSEADEDTETEIQGIYYAEGKLRFRDGTSCEPEGTTAKIVYSYNGIDWQTYGTNATLSAEHTKVYVRSVETAKTAMSTIKEIIYR